MNPNQAQNMQNQNGLTALANQNQKKGSLANAYVTNNSQNISAIDSKMGISSNISQNVSM